MGARVYVFTCRYVQVYVEVRGQSQVPSSDDAFGEIAGRSNHLVASGCVDGKFLKVLVIKIK